MNIGQYVIRACRRRGHTDYGYHLLCAASRYDLKMPIEQVQVIGSALLIIARLADVYGGNDD